MMMLDDMEIFHEVVNRHGFSTAAKALGISKSSVSKRIQQLEKRVGVQLLTRSTRQITLTESGERFFQYCKQALSAAKDGYAYLDVHNQQPQGHLKISAPPSFAQHILPTVMLRYAKLYPQVSWELDLEPSLVNLTSQHYDCILRSAKLEDSNFIATKLSPIKMLWVGTGEYFKKNPMPKHPNDLYQHKLAAYTALKNKISIETSFKGKTYRIDKKLYINCNFLPMMKQAALKNLCLAYLPDFLVAHECQTKKLITCFGEDNTSRAPMYALYPYTEFTPPKVRELIRLLREF